MAKSFKEFLNEEFKPFVYKNFEVSEARSWDPNKFISHHAKVRSQERFPSFSTTTWQGLIKFAIIKLGDEFISAKDPDSPAGYTGYKSFAIKFNHDGYAGWMTLRVRRHPENRVPKRYNLMAITVLGPDQPPLKKHNDIIRSLPNTKTPSNMVAEAEELTEELHIPNIDKSPSKRRFSMPQIDSKDMKKFIDWAKEEYNIKTDLVKIVPDKYTPVQKEFNEDKVTALLSSGKYRELPIFVSGDGYVIDGHHRWAAAAQVKEKIQAYVMKGNVAEVLRIASLFPKAYKKKLHEDKDPCWDGYEMVGTKKKDGKEVPNCVPKNEATGPNPIAKGMLMGKTGGGAHKKAKGKGSYDRKKEKKVSKHDY